MKIVKRLLITIGILVLVIGGSTFWMLYRSGAFREIKPHFAGRCEAVPLPGSSEDIQVDRERGMAYLSVIDRKSIVEGKDAQGTVMRVDLNTRPFAAVDALLSRPSSLRPHGLSLYVGADGVRRLFVINHGRDRGGDSEAVELFIETAPGEFSHVETFHGRALNSPNDLVAVGPRQFYVANDKALGGAFAGILQMAGIGASPLSYFDGGQARDVLTDIASGGGINAAPDYRTLYIAETTGKRLRIVDRGEDGSVSERMRVELDTAPDNIDVAADGSLWVAGHANTLALVRHFIGGTPAPSQVWRVALGPGAAASVEELYLDDGKQISAGSVGATWDKLLLIGSITERKILICERAGP